MNKVYCRTVVFKPGLATEKRVAKPFSGGTKSISKTTIFSLRPVGSVHDD